MIPDEPENADEPRMTAGPDAALTLTDGVQSDLGPAVVAEIYKHLMVDDMWSVRDDRSFRWWSFRLAQTIEASVPRVVLGDPTVRIHASTDVVVRVGADPADVRTTLDAVNRNAGMNTLIWHPEDETVTLDCNLYAHVGNAPMVRIFGGSTLVQNIVAHNVAEALADALDGEAATSEHPIAGERPEMDDLLNFGEQVIAPTGAASSRFVGPELAELTNDDGGFGWVLAGGDHHGMTGELPFTGTTPAAVRTMGRQLLPHLDGGDDALGTSLVSVTTRETNPGLGNGVLLTLRLPSWVEQDAAIWVADTLNRSEAEGFTGIPLLGSWCADDSLAGNPTVCWVTFLPNFMAAPGLLQTATRYLVWRNAWALDRLAALDLLPQSDG